MKKQWLVAVGDDDPLYSATVKTWLQREGHRVAVYPTPETFLLGVRRIKPDVALLDVVFDRQNGCKLCRDLRDDPATKDIPLILVSALRREVADMVNGLEHGADDYLLKPLDRQLTLAKLNCVMQRLQAPEDLAGILVHYGMSLDVHGRRARVGSRDVPLTRMEFDLLTYLLRHKGRVLSVRQLLEAVWDYEPEVPIDSATVQVHISRLRKKLGESFAARLKTLVNAGYRLD
jgi:two-component system phosphate regulon response regulator PhoB